MDIQQRDHYYKLADYRYNRIMIPMLELDGETWYIVPVKLIEYVQFNMEKHGRTYRNGFGEWVFYITKHDYTRLYFELQNMGLCLYTDEYE